MTIELINPPGLPDTEMYRQVAIATGTTMVFLSGQVARDADGTPVGTGDLAAQVEQAVRNVNTGVVAAGGSFADIAKLTVYVVDWSLDKMQPFGEGLMRAAIDLGVDPTKAVTLIGVAALAEPDLLVEIEAVAVFDASINAPLVRRDSTA